MKLLSWNVNGIRAVHRKKRFLDLLESEEPDILCVQETKAEKGQLPEKIVNVSGYESYFDSAEKKGYSGVALYTKPRPQKVTTEIGTEKFDKEGRIQIADYTDSQDFVLFNVYFPNGQMTQERLKYKMAFYKAFLEYVKALVKKQKKIIICGDVNTAHNEIDLARPKQNSDRSGFLQMERDWIDKLLAAGFVDTFRNHHKKEEKYSFWDYRTKARERNIGWRVDYFFASEGIKDRVEDAFILTEVVGSDHCPVGITLKQS